MSTNPFASAAPTDSSSPLAFAISLYSQTAATNITTTNKNNLLLFAHHLEALHHAAYLNLLPRGTREESDFHKTESTRLTHSSLGDLILYASSLFFTLPYDNDGGAEDQIRRFKDLARDIYDATDRMLDDLENEHARYLDNMTLLLHEMKQKWQTDLSTNGSWHHLATHLKETGIASARALADLVESRPLPLPHRRVLMREKYLSEIARYWRNWGGSGEYEEIWTYVAGRALRVE